MESKKNFVQEILKKKESGFGRLHLVKKSRKEFQCRECSQTIRKGSLSYRQNDYTSSELLPTSTRVCEDCGKIQIENGVEVK